MSLREQFRRDLLEKPEKRRVADKIRYDSLDSDECMLCHAHGADKRPLTIACFYDISEAIPEAIDLWYVEGMRDRGWYLRICKHCRGALLQHLGTWRADRINRRDLTLNHDGYEEEYEE
ncbi:hypothetical protein LCGC14_1584850 [marine sediment metagenome]|uniref:Uncharacterized protein n=1 Tax=marine sediment metagenome TaxID=412755 RepID=A0A0F9IFZ1_9ZZZZ